MQVQEFKDKSRQKNSCSILNNLDAHHPIASMRHPIERTMIAIGPRFMRIFFLPAGSRPNRIVMASNGSSTRQTKDLRTLTSPAAMSMATLSRRTTDIARTRQFADGSWGHPRLLAGYIATP